MQHVTENILPLNQSRGGRIGSTQLRESIEQSQDFTGLEENVNRYDLLLLVKRTGKLSGFTPRMINLLDYYMSFTRDIDWEQGSSPVIYQSLSRTALDMGVSERQIQRLEQSLFDAGALTWNDSGNHRRYGKREDKSGRILFAYGVDLTPLAYLKDALSKKLQEKRLTDQAWMETKRQISYYRSQIRAVMCEMELLIMDGQGTYAPELIELQNSYDPLAIQIRTHLPLEKVRELLVSHKELYSKAVAKLNTQSVDNSSITQEETNKRSSTSDIKDTHYNYTNKKQSNKLDTISSKASPIALQKSTSSEISADKADLSSQVETTKSEDEVSDEELILKTGLQHITLKQALNAASDNFKDHIPMRNKAMDWNDFIDAAYKMKGGLSISQSSWARSCGVLGRSGAAICLLLTDQAQHREHKPVQKTGAYFNAMINRAKTGDLNLHSSIFGILKREFGEISQA